ncbi:DUF6461 domain-containing protein [Streptomyces sp. JH14]|uniref:DUF6461 domain-containing protein n=1 Tax=Streptomyces sp. JH14 TaxID=2793630 RepID=UPI0023F67C34|nr:DUF6461 domain-containing protein [Streptomyces sp. JH14]MDF6045869.1 DUF6461 domain-containing protein [Streptomyces sp. JH14]
MSWDWAKAWMRVTFTRGLGPEEVLTRYGADPAQARQLDWDAASDLPAGDLDGGMVSLLRSGSLGDWALCVKGEGGIGLEDEVLAALSRGTETYCVATADGMDVFQYWRDGECVEHFEPGMEYSRTERTTPGGTASKRPWPPTRTTVTGWPLWWHSSSVISVSPWTTTSSPALGPA